MFLHQAGIQQDASEQAAIYEVGRAVQDFIDAHYLEDISIADIAKHLHMGESYISHSFKKPPDFRESRAGIRKALACTRDNKTTKGTIGDNGSFCLVKNS